jgi:hypothetical protein
MLRANDWPCFTDRRKAMRAPGWSGASSAAFSARNGMSIAGM